MWRAYKKFLLQIYFTCRVLFKKQYKTNENVLNGGRGAKSAEWMRDKYLWLVIYVYKYKLLKMNRAILCGIYFPFFVAFLL